MFNPEDFETEPESYESMQDRQYAEYEKGREYGANGEHLEDELVRNELEAQAAFRGDPNPHEGLNVASENFRRYTGQQLVDGVEMSVTVNVQMLNHGDAIEFTSEFEFDSLQKDQKEIIEKIEELPGQMPHQNFEALLREILLECKSKDAKGTPPHIVMAHVGEYIR